ncbi:MAG: sigma 54-interacting transcriptional regulator [Isosphaeraceae bacterium]
MNETRAWAGRPYRAFVMAFSVGVLLYSLAVLLMVMYMGDIGVRCVFSNEIREPVSSTYYRWMVDRPGAGDRVLTMGPVIVANYADYVKGLRLLSREVDGTTTVTWQEAASGVVRSATVEVRNPPAERYLWSIVWFLQEMVIFAIGARVFWKRPGDDSARLFFWLCTLTVGAYMGGYHWTEIVAEPALIYPFAAFAVFLPAVTLHFYLVFPRTNPLLQSHRGAVLGLLYGVPAVYLAALWGAMGWSRWLSDYGASGQVVVAVQLIRNLALGYVGLASVLFLLCVSCVVLSYRRAAGRHERNQVQWILLASLISALLIGYLLCQAWLDPSTLGRDNAAWPMFSVSLLYTLAYAMSITRYKLMQVEQIINRSVAYVSISVSAGLLYSAVLILSGVLFRDSLLSPNQTWRGALVAALTVVLILTLSEFARGRFQQAIDRRFYREKYKLDQAMRKMRLAVGSLVDRETLGRRLLEAAAEVLRLEWGAIYLRESPGEPYRLTACHGPAPDERVLAPENPLVERLRRVPALRVPRTVNLPEASDPATDAMISLGGEAANALESDGDLAGLLVLGPKRSGMPYEDEELAFLGALSSVATLVLHSAGIQETLETLNAELRDKVGKIAEQQRRILILQDQLTDRSAVRRDAPHEPEGTDGADPLDSEAGADGVLDADSPGARVFDRIKGSSQAVRRTIELARKVAASPSAVLIRGESGTGKELLAEAIHAACPRSDRPFVKVHCAALSQTLLESELFGHVKGAFTGADRDRVGRFEQANGGTLFLDEIGDINLEVQTKLLRVLQEMSFERVGSSQTMRVDVRVLAATHQNLEALIASGRFREDLYYRLNVISVTAPALRDRAEDIFELAVHFLRRHANRSGRAVTHLDESAVEALEAYHWPGNVRELENVIERAVVLADGPAVTRDDLPAEIRRPGASGRRLAASASARAAEPNTSLAASFAASESAPSTPAGRFLNRDRRASLNRRRPPTATRPGRAGRCSPATPRSTPLSRQRLLDALQEARENKSEAARLLGMPRSTFCSKLKKHGLE